MIISKKKILDYFTLSKPGINFLSLISTFTSFFLASNNSFDFLLLFHTLFGTFLASAGGGALNMATEVEIDSIMERTKKRPIPQNRISHLEGFIFGFLCTLFGILYLTNFVNHLSGFLVSLSIFSYVFVYTPLKKVTSLSTVVGGIPGAIPILIGWSAVRNEISFEAFSLFAILYIWQIPHFLSIAILYKDDYKKAEIPMITVANNSINFTYLQIILHLITLIPISLSLYYFDLVSQIYFIGALILSLVFLYFGIQLVKNKTLDASRTLLKTSIYYIPFLFFLILIDRIINQ